MNLTKTLQVELFMSANLFIAYFTKKKLIRNDQYLLIISSNLIKYENGPKTHHAHNTFVTIVISDWSR